VIVNAGLITYGIMAYPGVFTGSSRDVVFATLLALALLGYMAAALFRTAHHAQPDRWAYRRGVSYGILIGVIWLSQTAYEAFFKPDAGQKANLEFAVFVAVFLLYVLAGLRGATAGRQLSAGVWAALWAGMVSSLLASAGDYVVKYVFMEPGVTKALFGTEFINLGAAPLDALAIQSTLSGVLIHLLVIGPLCGALLGFIGALAGRFYHATDRATPRSN
jgi:hypothetical protein